MNEAFWIKVIVVAIFGCLLGSFAFKRDQMDLYDVNPTEQRYLPYLNSTLLPVFILLDFLVEMMQTTELNFFMN